MHPLRHAMTFSTAPRRITLSLLLLGLALALGLIGNTLRVHAQRDIPNVVLTKEVAPTTDPIRPGDVVYYVTRLHYTHERAQSPEFGLMEEIPWPLRLAGRVEVDVLTPGISAEQVRITYQRLENGQTNTIIGWRGTMQPDAEFAIRVPVQVQFTCRPTQTERTITSAATLRAGDMSMTRDAQYTVACLPEVTLDDIEVSLEMIDGRASTPEASSTGPRAGNAANYIDTVAWEFGLRASLTNNSSQTVLLGYVLERNYVGETEKNLAACEPSKVARGECGALTQIILDPGESRSLEVWTDMRPLSVHLNQLEPVSAEILLDDWLFLHADFHYLLLPAVQFGTRAANDSDGAEVRTIRRTVRVQAWDVGDAPDSSNHFNTPMTAYPGVQANFPTVHNPNVNPTQIGPAHARPRHFHLGRSVSTEIDADLGIARNIDPVNNIADLDLYDDGAVPHLWNLQHCRPTTIDVRIFISPQAAAWFAHNRLGGYLNGWIDSNRDGDWGDVLSCDDGRGPAFEHFIIDEPIDVAGLGPGYHTIKLETGRVYWPAERAQDPAWVRLTLSEQPSVKVGRVGTVQFGDGRGPARPFRLGETEDYLLRPRGSTGAGPNLVVTLNGSGRPLSELRPAAVEAAFTYQKIEWTWVVGFANEGTDIAEDVVLTFDVPAGLRGQDAQLTLVAPRRDAQTIDVSTEKLTINLETIEPGERGRLLVSFIPDIGDEVVLSYMTKADIIWSHATRPGSDTTSFKVEIEGVTQGAFGFKSPGLPFLVQQGTTNSPDLILQGYYQDHIASEGFVRIWVHKLLDAARTEMDTSEVYEAPLDKNGRWTLELNDLPDGFYQFAVGDAAACIRGPEWWEDVIFSRTLAGNGNEWRWAPSGQRSLHGYGTVCGLAVVDSKLPIDPISIGFVEVPKDAAEAAVGSNSEAYARIYQPNTLNWSNGDWGVRLPPGEYFMLVLGVDEFVQEQSYIVMEITGFGSFETKRLVDPLEPFYIPGRHSYRTVNSFIIHELEKGFIIGDGGGMPGNIASAHTESDEVIITLELTTPAQAIEFAGSLGMSDFGQVLDRTTGQPLAGATVMLLVPVLGSDGHLDFIPWNGSEIDQPNPVFTDERGRYRLTPPAGRYQLLIRAEGYRPFRTNVVAEGGHGRDLLLWDRSHRAYGSNIASIGEAIAGTVTLSPAVMGEPQTVIIMDQDSIEPAVVTVAPGTIVRFINLEMTPRRIMSEGMAPAHALEETQFDSGWLLLGESFTLQAGESGEIPFSDESGFGGLLRVGSPTDDEPDDDDPEIRDSPAIFLPHVSR